MVAKAAGNGAQHGGKHAALLRNINVAASGVTGKDKAGEFLAVPKGALPERTKRGLVRRTGGTDVHVLPLLNKTKS